MSLPTQPIKVIHIASGDLWAGAEVQLFTLAKALQKLEQVSVKVILLNHGELETRLRTQGIPVDVLPETKLNGIQIFLQLITLLKKHKPDVVHTHRLKENILGGLAAKFTGNIPSLRTSHGAAEHKPGWKRPHKQLIYNLDWFVGRFIQSKIVAVSEDLATLLKRNFPSEKITTIENGVDIEALAPYIKQQISKRQSTDPVKVGLIGRLVPVKRVDIFIETAKYLKDHYPTINANFHIYGDGPLRANLEQFSNSLGIQNIVYFEGHQTEIHSAMSTLDALLITSDHEGLPMTLLEAMVLEIPIIAHAVGGIPNVLDKIEGILKITQQEPELYVQAIIEYIAHPKKTANTTKHARLYTFNNYSSTKNGRQYFSIYKQIK